MNENKKVAWLYVVLTVIASAVAVVFQYILLNDYAEASTGLYPRDAMTPVAFYVFLAIAAVLVCMSSIMLRKDVIPTEPKRFTWYNGVVSACAAIAVIVSGAKFFKDSGLFDGMASFKTINKLELAGACMAFFAGAYFVSILLLGKKTNNIVPLLSFFVVLWTLFYLLNICFDKNVLVNSPAKALRQLSLIFLMIFQLLESRALIGKSKPRLYFVFSLLSVVFMSASVFPELIMWYKGDRVLTLDATYLIYFSVIVVYVLTRAISFAIYSDGEAVYLQSKKNEQRNKQKDVLFTSDDDSE